jgi:hypothetical protein
VDTMIIKLPSNRLEYFLIMDSLCFHQEKGVGANFFSSRIEVKEIFILL